MKCEFCGNDIVGEPFVKKEYPTIQVSEVYHTQCFVIAHQSQLNFPVDDEIIDSEVMDLIAFKKKLLTGHLE